MTLTLNTVYTGSDNIYAIIRDRKTMYVWNGDNFEEWDEDNLSTYAIELANNGGDFWSAEFPSSITYGTKCKVFYYIRKNEVPTGNDLLHDRKDITVY